MLSETLHNPAASAYMRSFNMHRLSVLVLLTLTCLGNESAQANTSCRTNAWRTNGCGVRNVERRSGLHRPPRRALSRTPVPRSSALVTRRGSTSYIIKKAAQEQQLCFPNDYGVDLRIVEAYLKRNSKNVKLSGLIKNYSKQKLRSALKIHVSDADTGQTRKYIINSDAPSVLGMMPFEIDLGIYDPAIHADKLYHYQLIYEPIRYCEIKSIEVNPAFQRGAARLVSSHIRYDQIAANLESIESDFHDLKMSAARNLISPANHSRTHHELTGRLSRVCPEELSLEDTYLRTRCRSLGDKLKAAGPGEMQ